MSKSGYEGIMTHGRPGMQAGEGEEILDLRLSNIDPLPSSSFIDSLPFHLW
jgi:hypothetical protein